MMRLKVGSVYLDKATSRYLHVMSEANLPGTQRMLYVNSYGPRSRILEAGRIYGDGFPRRRMKRVRDTATLAELFLLGL